MKIRVGFGFGGSARLDATDLFGRLVAALETHKFDSLWVSERATGLTLDPMVAMAYAAGRTEHLKFGPAVMVLPGRNPVLCAKAVASLDVVSGGRALPAFGLGIAAAAEHQAFGVTRGERAAWFDEALPLMRRLWDAGEDAVDHRGERFHLDGVRVAPKPIQQPIDVWLGGFAPSELRRCGRLGDGWLPSFATPQIVADGITVVQAEAAAHDRHIDPEHFGALVPFVHRALPDRFVERLRQRQPDVDPGEVVATGVAGLATRLTEFVDAGASKFVVFPLAEPDDWASTVGAVAAECLPLPT